MSVQSRHTLISDGLLAIQLRTGVIGESVVQGPKSGLHNQ
jgi:hypothetical protein